MCICMCVCMYKMFRKRFCGSKIIFYDKRQGIKIGWFAERQFHRPKFDLKFDFRYIDLNIFLFFIYFILLYFVYLFIFYFILFYFIRIRHGKNIIYRRVSYILTDPGIET